MMEEHAHHRPERKDEEHRPDMEDEHAAHAQPGEHTGSQTTSNTHDEHGGHSGAAGHAGHGVDHSGHEAMFRTRFWWSLLLSIPVLVYSEMIQHWLGFRPPAFPGSEWVPFVFSVVIFAYGGMPFLSMALPELRNRAPGMMTLISLAISVAFVYSVVAQLFNLGEDFFWELVTLIDIMLLGHWLEMRSVRQASGALNELAKLMPDTAERIHHGDMTESVPVSALQTGDLVLVRPGASIPADGEVVEGHSDVNEALITGESQPVHKMAGVQVIAGTINGEGSLRVRVTATGQDTALAGIMRLVEQAQQSKSKTQVLADRAAGWLFYIALAAALVTGVAWTIADAFNVDTLNRVVTVLVIACPHALGLAVPLVVAITTAMGASNGILVRNRLALEAAREIDVVVFDKTGTLTKGEFGVVEIATDNGWEAEQALALAAALEGDSEHLIARAIRQHAQERELELPKISNFSSLKGRGVQAIYKNQTYYVGGPRLLEMLSLKPNSQLQTFTDEASRKAQTVVYLTGETEVQAAFAIADVIRSESKQVVDELNAMGIEVAMLTGDSRAVAEAVAEQLGIQQVFGEVLPEHKDEQIADLQAQGKRVAMVGDGVNDAPALTRADVGIAIGGGTDVAIESAGVILVNDNPLDVVKIFRLSRSSYRKMIQNLWWAAGYNIVAIPLAAGVLAPWNILLSPAIGAVLMSLSTIIVAINAQLLRREEL
jgi:P-type Cu2+ transporter